MTVPSAPISPYGTLSGQLFVYAAGRVAFESYPAQDLLPSSSSSSPSSISSSRGQQQQQPATKNKCILLGGLSDGLLPVPYTQALEKACAAVQWSLVQPILSSSYLGFGNGSLERDTSELNELISYLIAHRQAENLCLVGHSTGGQNAVHYLKYGDANYIQRLKLVVLQAPVSDREHAVMENPCDNEKYLQIALEMKAQNKLNEMMPRQAFWAPITASRFLDLHEKGGADDFFSSDYTDEELATRLRHVGQQDSTKVLVAFSGSDEYVPESIDCEQLTERLVQAMNADCRAVRGDDQQQPPVAQALFLPTANHNLSKGEGDAEVFVAKVGEMLQQSIN